METKFTHSRNFKYLFIILLTLAAMLPSCSKNDNNDLNANVMIVNSFEGSAAQDFYLNSAKVNTQAVAYAQSSSYISTASGDKVAEFKNTGSAQANATSNTTLEGGKYYTFYYTGSGSSSQTAKTEDDMSAPPSGKCKVRYINLNANGSSNIDFSFNGTKLGSNLAYKSASSFTVMDPGTLTFKILTAGTTNLVFDMPVTLQAGKIYTLWASGSTVLTSHLIAHN
jgi:hypothetical protein